MRLCGSPALKCGRSSCAFHARSRAAIVPMAVLFATGSSTRHRSVEGSPESFFLRPDIPGDTAAFTRSNAALTGAAVILTSHLGVDRRHEPRLPHRRGISTYATDVQRQVNASPEHDIARCACPKAALANTSGRVPDTREEHT